MLKVNDVFRYVGKEKQYRVESIQYYPFKIVYTNEQSVKYIRERSGAFAPVQKIYSQRDPKVNVSQLIESLKKSLK